MKFSKTNVALLFFTALLILSISALFYMQSKYHPSYFVNADKLGQKPANYFPLPSPDQYVIEALQKPGIYITINSLKDTQIDELLEKYVTSNIEYNGEFYKVNVVAVDSFPPFMLPEMILAGIVISIFGVVIAFSKIVLKMARTFFLKQTWL